MSAQEYTKRLREAFIASRPWMYDGREGALRLAREYGSCLTDSPDHEARKALRDSYLQLCVRGYNMSPPVNAKEWHDEALKSYEKSLKRRKGGVSHGCRRCKRKSGVAGKKLIVWLRRWFE